MPYRWTDPADVEVQELVLWPHQSLPSRGMAAFVLATFVLILIPTFPLIGTPILWGLLPFLLMAVWGIYFALQQNYKSRQILEVLTLGAENARLVRTDPNGDLREWQANRYWARVKKYDDKGPVPHYLTLVGANREVEIGAFLSEEERIGLYDELTRAFATR